VLALAGGLLSAFPAAWSFQASTAAQAADQAAKSATSSKKSSRAKSKTATKKKTGTQAAARRRRRVMSPRVRRIRQAFVASTTLRPMAQQLIQDRTPAAYAGVEAYARAHAKEDAGALAWLAVGYAHVIDHEYVKAIDPLNRAKPLAGDLGDYVAYYLGQCYLQTGRQAEGMATLATFSSTYPDSLLARDAHFAYANGLLSEGRAAEAAEILEKDRLPARSDIEFAVGKAYAALGQTGKAAEAFSNVYFNMPSSPDADNAYSELIKLHGAPPTTTAKRKARAE
jgi:soluble lytic murein transglycosylase